MALRKKLLESLVFNPTILNHHRWYGTERKKMVTGKMRPMILKRIQKRSKDYPIKAFIPVAQEVLKFRNTLFLGVSSLLKAFTVVTCKFCSEVYVGEEGHLIKNCHGFKRQSKNVLHHWTVGGLSDILVPVEAFHLDHMFQNVILHSQRFDYDRVPAVVELCYQAGAKPSDDLYPNNANSDGSELIPCQDLKSVAETTLAAWEALRDGVTRLLLVYPCKVCKYCPEVHVGPSGHLARNCGLFKFQSWRGTHFWQKAEVDDLVPPRIVWRRRPHDPPMLVDEMRNFYGHLPAVVDLCSKAGVVVPAKYNCLMKIRGMPVPLQ